MAATHLPLAARRQALATSGRFSSPSGRARVWCTCRHTVAAQRRRPWPARQRCEPCRYRRRFCDHPSDDARFASHAPMALDSEHEPRSCSGVRGPPRAGSGRRPEALPKELLPWVPALVDVCLERPSRSATARQTRTALGGEGARPLTPTLSWSSRGRGAGTQSHRPRAVETLRNKGTRPPERLTGIDRPSPRQYHLV